MLLPSAARARNFLVEARPQEHCFVTFRTRILTTFLGSLLGSRGSLLTHSTLVNSAVYGGDASPLAPASYEQTYCTASHSIRPHRRRCRRRCRRSCRRSRRVIGEGRLFQKAGLCAASCATWNTHFNHAYLICAWLGGCRMLSRDSNRSSLCFMHDARGTSGRCWARSQWVGNGRLNV